METLEEKIAKIMAAATPSKLDKTSLSNRIPSSVISTPESSDKFTKRNLNLSLMEELPSLSISSSLGEDLNDSGINVSKVAKMQEDPEITGETPFKDLDEETQEIQEIEAIHNNIDNEDFHGNIDADNDGNDVNHNEVYNAHADFDNELVHPRDIELNDDDNELVAESIAYSSKTNGNADEENDGNDLNPTFEHDDDDDDDVDPLRESTSLDKTLQFSPPSPSYGIVLDADAAFSSRTPNVVHSPVRGIGSLPSFTRNRNTLPASNDKSVSVASPDRSKSPYIAEASQSTSEKVNKIINTPVSVAQNKPKFTPRSRASSSERKTRTSVGFGRSSSTSTVASEFTPQHRRLPSTSLSVGGQRPSTTPGLRDSFNSSGLDAAEATFHEMYSNWSLGQKRLTQISDFSRHMSSATQVQDENATTVNSALGNEAKSELVLNQNTSMSHQRGMKEDAKIKVAVRVRPFLNTEKQQASRRIVSSLDNRVVIVNPSSFDADPDAIVAATAAVQGAEWARAFKFNECLWSYDPQDKEDEYIDQEGVHRAIGLEIVENVLNGISSCCFAYGHTGTGKTHSFFGDLAPPVNEFDDDIAEDLSKRYKLSEQSGLIPRVLTDIIEGLRKRDDTCDDTKLTVSFMEIYNERIRDLLHPSPSSLHNTYELEEDSFISGTASNATFNGSATGGSAATGLRVREHPILGPYVDKLTKVEVTSPMEALRLLYEGHKNRTTAQTQWNAESSRSHAIVTLELTPRRADFNSSQPLASPLTRTSLSVSFASTAAAVQVEEVTPFVRLQMVDLAGSEQAPLIPRETAQRPVSASKKGLHRSSLVDANESTKTDLLIEKQENKFIRRSLSTLGYIIKALGKGASFKSLPYRDTVLTWLLRDSLNGRNHTTMLATISPAHTCYEETMNTLKYAERMCSISSRSNHLGEYSLFDNNEGARSQSSRDHKSSGGDGGDDSFTADEYAHIFQSLGANRPGTKAYRQLLKQTVTDPQQRLARLFGDQQGGNNIKSVETALSLEDEAKIADLTHTLQSRITELELELKSTCIERDSYAVELQTARQQLLEKSTFQTQTWSEESHNSFFGSGLDSTRKSSINNNSTNSRGGSIGGGAPVTVQVERELAQMREIVLRKEDLIERLQNECRNEQRIRVSVEESAREKLTDLQSLLIQLQRDNDALGSEVSYLRQSGSQDLSLRENLEQFSAESRQLKNDLNAALADKSYYLDQLNELQARMADLTSTLDDQNRASLDTQRRLESIIAEKSREIEVLRQRLEKSSYGSTNKWDSERRVIEEGHKERLASLREEIQTLRNEKDSRDKTIQRLTIEHDLSRAQQPQQRESSLDEVHFAVVNLLKSQRLLSQDESSASVDRARMVRLLGDMKANVTSQATQIDSLRREADKERNMRVQLEREATDLLSDKSKLQTKIGQGPSTAELAHLISEELATRLNVDRGQTVKDVATDKLCQMLLDQATQLRKELESAESKSQHWQQVAQSVNSFSDKSSFVSVEEQQEQSVLFQRLRDENLMVKEQLLSAKNDASIARSELRERQNSSQIEFASLWLAVQELNKLDSEKEATITRLKDEKGSLEKEREELSKRLKDMSRRYQHVWDELHEFDKALKEVAEEEQIDILFGKKNKILTSIRPTSGTADSRPLSPQSSATSLPSPFGGVGKPSSDMFPRHEYLQQQQQMPQQLSTRSSQQYQQPAQQTQFLQTQTSYPQSQKPIGLRLDMQQVMSGASRPSSAGSYSAPISSTPATTPSYVSESSLRQQMDRINGFLQSEDIRTRALSTRRGPSSVGTKAVRGQSPARLSNVSNVSFNPAPAISIIGRGSATTATGRRLSPSRPHSSRSNAMANSGNRR